MTIWQRAALSLVSRMRKQAQRSQSVCPHSRAYHVTELGFQTQNPRPARLLHDHLVCEADEQPDTRVPLLPIRSTYMPDQQPP